jgi:hypothetical protein
LGIAAICAIPKAIRLAQMSCADPQARNGIALRSGTPA